MAVTIALTNTRAIPGRRNPVAHRQEAAHSQALVRHTSPIPGEQARLARLRRPQAQTKFQG